MPRDKETVLTEDLVAEDKGLSRTPRRLLFLSHATPQDSAFAKWLATQLAIAGYEVWCDVTKLLGGERFWKDITEAIDGYAFRFLFASTIESNRKPGSLRELKIALDAQEKYRLQDFVVPLKVDQFPFESTQATIRDLNFVRFDENWASGLSRLLKLLEREGAPKSGPPGRPALPLGINEPEIRQGTRLFPITAVTPTGSGFICRSISCSTGTPVLRTTCLPSRRVSPIPIASTVLTLPHSLLRILLARILSRMEALRKSSNLRPTNSSGRAMEGLRLPASTQQTS